ncbi:glutathione S-transferase [Amorphus suaedae]
MKLFYSLSSPYVRKVMVIALETGQASDIEKLPSAASPVARDATIVAVNPLGKVPTLILDDGSALYDSRAIAMYLDARHDGAPLYPADGPERWTVMRWEALADGLLDAALLLRYETFMRPEEKRWPEWIAGQYEKIASALDVMEAEIGGRGEIDAGLIAAGCALGYLDLRFADLGWRDSHPALAAWFAGFAERPSMVATKPE